MSRSTTPLSHAVHHGACAPAPASASRANFYARVRSQLMRLLAQMALR